MLQEVGGRGWGRWEGRGRGSEEPCASGGRGEGMGEMRWEGRGRGSEEPCASGGRGEGLGEVGGERERF